MTVLASVPVRRIVRAINDAAQRWCDADFPPRVRTTAAIEARTGYSLPVLEYALDRLFFSLTDDALEATIAGELGSLDILDAFVERTGRPAARALPVGTLCAISSRTTIGVALVPAIFALCAKCDVLVKDREDALVAAFFATLVQEDDVFASAARAESWEGQGDAHDLARFDAVVAFGSDGTLAHVRERIATHARFIGYGARASVGYVTRATLCDAASARALAEGAARDVLLYDGEGCLSLHALFVERGGAIHPQAFGALLAESLERGAVEFPPSDRSAETAARVAGARNTAAFRAATGSGSVFSDAHANFLAVLDPPLDEPPPFLPRALAVHPVDTPDEALAYLRRHELPLEAFALSEQRADVVTMAIAAGASRIARFGSLQSPPLGGNHGGRARIADFVRWVTRER